MTQTEFLTSRFSQEDEIKPDQMRQLETPRQYALRWILLFSLMFLLFAPAVRGQSGDFAVVSAANFKSGNLAAEMIVSGFSEAVPNVFVLATALPLPTTLEGVSVSVTDSVGVSRNAALFGAFNNETIGGQVNFLIPEMTALGAATMELKVNGIPVASGTAEIADVSPGIFTADSSGTGVAAALFLRVLASMEREEDLIFDPATREAVPLDFGASGDLLYLQLFGTGMRGSRGIGVEQSRLEALAEVNGVPTGVLGIAESPEFVGLDQAAIGPIDRNLLSGKGEVDVELWINGVSTGYFSTSFGGPVITQPAQITGVMPSGLMPGATSAVTINGSRLSPITRVEFQPNGDIAISNLQSTSTTATFDVMVEENATRGMRTVAVITPTGRSNRFDIEILEPTNNSFAPSISNLVLDGIVDLDEVLVVRAAIDWEDPDGDIIWTGDVETSAKFEARLKGDNGECLFILAGPLILDSPDEMMKSLSIAGPRFDQDIVFPGTGIATVTLIDAAQNRSQSLTIEVPGEPIPGACDPTDPIVNIL